MPKGLYCTAVFSFFLFSFFFFSTPNLWGHWADLNQTWTYIHLWLLFENFGPKSPGVHGLGAKTAFWDRLRTLTKNISAKEHNINNQKETRQCPRIRSTPLYLVNFGTQTAKNDERVSAHPLKFARRTSCRLTFARHFGLIIFARWRIWSTQIPRAWLALVRLRAVQAHDGLCHVSSSVYIFYVVRFRIMFRRIWYF